MGEKNIIIFGQTGSGKSSLVNLMAGEERAKTSDGSSSCTMAWVKYPMAFGGCNFRVYDTRGIGEPQLEIDEYIAGIENSYSLIRKLQEEDGIDLLLFCLRAGRFTRTTRTNYRLFYEFFCEKKVPIVLVITGLEKEPRMDDWWSSSKSTFDRFGIIVDGHACITAIDEMAWRLRYEESRYLVHDLILSHYRRNDMPRDMGGSGFLGFLMFLLRFFSLRKDPVTFLVDRCDIPQEAAERLADMKRDRIATRHQKSIE